MRAKQEQNNYIREQLSQGVPATVLMSEGIPKSTIYAIAKKLKTIGPDEADTPIEEGQAVNGRGRRRTSAGRGLAGGSNTSTRVRLTQEEFVLPSDIFIWYDLCRAVWPDYLASKSEWLVHLVSTWAEDYGEDIRRGYLGETGRDPMRLLDQMGDEEEYDHESVNASMAGGTESARTQDDGIEPD